jgi:hypothetical protein
MGIASGIGTVDHAVTFGTTDMAGRNHLGIHLVDIDCNPVVKDIAFAFKILSAGLDAILDDAPVELVDILEALFQKISRSLFAFDSTGAIGQNLFAFEMLKFFNLFGKIPEIVDIQRQGSFEPSKFMLIVGPDIEDDYVFLVFECFEFFRSEVFAGFDVGV